MAKARKRRPSAGRPPAAPPAQERREGVRRALWRRAVVILVVVVVGWVLFIRAPGPGAISAAALRAGRTAGCAEPERPVEPAPSRAHLASGETLDDPDPPPAAGPHDPDPLPAEPHVHAEPVSVARAVHNLEHAYVLIWYRPSAEGGPDEDTIDALEAVARDEDRVIMAPYPDLPEDRALTFVAWNTRWRCPAGVSPDDAVTMARSFIRAYRGTTNAPEAPRGLLGPRLSA